MDFIIFKLRSKDTGVKIWVLAIQRTTGVEPASQAWEAWIMPLYDVRLSVI